MIGLNTAAVYVLQTLGSLYLLIVLLRFVLQLVRANFYNPLCQFVVKATQPLLKPLRRIIPSLFGLDMSSLVLAILVQLALMALTLLLTYGTTGNPLPDLCPAPAARVRPLRRVPDAKRGWAPDMSPRPRGRGAPRRQYRGVRAGG